jgi:hypothetical protein
MLLILAGWRVGVRGRLIWLCLLMIASLLLSLYWAVIEYPRLLSVLDVHWVTTNTHQAVEIYLQLLGSFALSFAAGGGAIASLKLRSGRAGETTLEGGALIIASAIAIAGVLGGLTLLALNALQPLIIDRYLCVWFPMASASLAAIAADSSFDGRAIAWTAAASAVTMISFQAKVELMTPDWGSGMADLSAAAAACPGTKIYAAPNWRFTNYSRTIAAARETVVLREGVRRLASEHHVPLRTWDNTTPVSLQLAKCPALVWIPHIWGVVALKEHPSELLRIGRVSLPPGARVSRLSSDNLIIRIDPRDV